MIIQRTLINIWKFLDPIYFKFTRLTYIDFKHANKENVFRVRPSTYLGKTIRLSDGTVISKKDKVLKIHLHNIRLIHELMMENNDLKRARYIYRATKDSLPGLASYLNDTAKHGEIKGVIGITTLNKGCQRLGFEVFPISNVFYKSFKTIIFSLISFLSIQSLSLRSLRKQPAYIIISKDQLLTIYNKNIKH